jgi:hypothetical protein
MDVSEIDMKKPSPGTKLNCSGVLRRMYLAVWNENMRT